MLATAAPIAAVQKAKQKQKQIKPIVKAKKIVKKAEKVKPQVAAKNVVKKTDKLKPNAVVKKTGRRMQKLKPAIGRPLQKQILKTQKAAPIKKTKPAVIQIEATKPLPVEKPKNRKARAIGSAVFRGKKERYDFKVFPLNERFEPIPAVYIISKRKTDRNKKGHHALVCIGETASISDELKRHRKGKCVKKHEANAVSILPEADAKTRLKIETDLKAAHTVACSFE